MDVYSALGDLPSDFGPSAVTIGMFDGVHLGHKKVIERLRADAQARHLVSTVLTFDRNPLSVLAPDACPAGLVSNAQRLDLLEESGVEATVILEFNRAFSENSPREFVENMLVSALHAELVLVGEDFRFGRRGGGNVALLKEMGTELGFTVDLLDAVEHDGRRVSSTWIRELLDRGDLRGAQELLARDPIVRATVVRGAQRGRALGFPTANLAHNTEGFVPADGVYAAWAIVDGDRYRAAVSIGNNPTFDGVPGRQVEAHLLGDGDNPIDVDLYGKSLELHFVARLRGMVKFGSVEALVAGMSEDVARVRVLLPDEPVTEG